MAASPTPEAKTERLLNLVIALLYTRSPLTKERIRTAVPQYADATNAEAFDRMFERDKDALRELGIPLRAEPIDAFFDDETGYRIDRREYALPDVHFNADELAVLGLAARAWQQASLAGPAAAALRKLEAVGVEADTESMVGIEPRIRTVEPSFDAVKDAVMNRQTIRFEYRKTDGTTSTRTLQPWSVTNRKGRWYVTGYDTGREAERVFRLSRIAGKVSKVGKKDAFEVPTDLDAQELIASTESIPDWAPAILRVRTGKGHSLVRRARTVGVVDDDWQLIDIEYDDVNVLASEVSSFGPDVVVEQPLELRDRVIERLRGALAASTQPVTTSYTAPSETTSSDTTAEETQ